MNSGVHRLWDDVEPTSGTMTAPIGLVMLFAGLFYGAAVYLNNHGGGFNAFVYQPHQSFAQVADLQPITEWPDLKRGRQLYENNCQGCHQANGMGTPGQCPPLARSDWVAHSSPHRLIRLVLNGGTGPITVSGKSYNYTMTPFKSTPLTDADYANILSFIRMNKDWGNNAPAVSPEQVTEIRNKLEGNNAMFSADQLLKIPDGE